MGILNKAKSNVVRSAMRSVNLTRGALRRRRAVKPRAGSEYLAVSPDALGLILTAYGFKHKPVALVAVAAEHVVARFDVEQATVESRADAYTATADYRVITNALANLTIATEDIDGVEGIGGEESTPEDGEDEGWKLQLGWLLEPSEERPVGASSSVVLGEHVVHETELEHTAGMQWIQWAGRASKTEASAFPRRHVNGHTVTPLITTRGNVRIDVNTPPALHALIYADDVCVQSNGIHVKGRVASAQGNVTQPRFVVVGRETGTRFESRMRLELDRGWTQTDFGRRRYRYDVRVPINPLMWDSFSNSEPFDAVVEFYDTEGVVHTRRVSRVPIESRVAARGGILESRGRIACVSPYFTFKAKALSFHIECFELSVKPLLTGTRKVDPQADVWLIGEQPWRAGDNGYRFFTWLRRKHPQINAYYVIDKDSPEIEKFSGEPNVVLSGTYSHFEKALQASKFIGTHHPDFLMPTYAPSFKARLRGTRVFLQHGVLGVKRMTSTYGKNAPQFNVDQFFVSSEKEREIVMNDLGYKADQVVVTGLPRFDSLLGESVEPRRGQVVVMPTWRDWIRDEEGFLASEYFQQWHQVLSSDDFARVVRENGLDVKLYLHTNMQRFAHHFEDLPVTVIFPGEEDVQRLMQESQLLITDYSSVAFDFSFLGRPVIYFQFDRGRFLGRNGSHLDLDAELPGYIEFTANDVVERLRSCAASGFEQTEELRARSRSFMTHRDTRNCERVFKAVITGPEHTIVGSGSPWKDAMPLVVRRFRRSRWYWKSMRAFYKAASVMPGKRETLVFESGLGKQYADSPRYIYEELLRRGDTRPKVWIYSGPHVFTDPNTEVVQRLSPEYYAALARAQIWTMNQSAPSYLKRPAKVRFVQTWHGTPLKHMQLDAAGKQEQSEGYLERAQAGVRQWTHLLSPSPYASSAFRSAFGFNGPIVELGYPRNDILVSDKAPAIREHTRAQLGLGKQRAILYAPTFRDNQKNARGKLAFQLPFDLETFAQQMPDDTVLLLRMHSLIASRIQIPEHLRDRVKDVSSYSDIQELFLASDALITDYSSVFFDAAVLRYPIVFFAYDLEDYQQNLRGFYLDYMKDLPGPIVQDEAELWATVNEHLEKGIDQGQRTRFIERFAPQDDGHAAERVVDELY